MMLWIKDRPLERLLVLNAGNPPPLYLSLSLFPFDAALSN